MICTLEQAKKFATDYIVDNKICADYTYTIEQTSNLLNKIGEMLTITTPIVDTMPELEGNTLDRGQIIEEYFGDLQPAQAFDENASDDLAPHRLHFKKAYYSYPLARKVIPITIDNKKYDPTALTQEDLIKITSMILTKAYESKAVYRNAVKMQLVSEIAMMLDKIASTYKIYGDYSAGDYILENTIIDVDPPDHLYRAVTRSTRALVAGDIDTSAHWTAFINEQIEAGAFVEYQVGSKIARPVDETTSKAFMLELNKVLEKTRRDSEGNSLSGATLGALIKNDLMLYVADGIIPTIDVYKSSLPTASLINFNTNVKPIGKYAEVKLTSDYFESRTSYAILVDTRGLKLKSYYNAMRQSQNGKADFTNIYQHWGDTAFLSANTFIHIFYA